MTQQPFFPVDRGQLRQLDAPLMVGDDVEIKDTQFVLGPEFQQSTVNAAIYLVGKRVRWRNSSIRGWPANYDLAWARDRNMVGMTGVRVDGAEDLIVAGFHGEGFPHSGLQGYGIRGARFERISSTRSFYLFTLSGARGGNKNIRVTQLRGWDSWGPGNGILASIGGAPSRIRPGGWSGSGVRFHGLEDALLMDFDISGELDRGLKLTRAKRVCLVDVRTNAIMFEGTEAEHANVDGSTDGSEQITVRRLMIDRDYGYGELSERGHGMQVSFNVRGLDVEDFTLLSGGSEGSAIQLYGNCQADFRGGVISGWNRGWGRPDGYACEVYPGCEINEDFETANRFYDQERKVLRRAA